MNAAQTVLKKENPFVFGLQNVNLELNSDYDVETVEFVQILHNGHGHWHVISTNWIKTSYCEYI